MHPIAKRLALPTLSYIVAPRVRLRVWLVATLVTALPLLNKRQASPRTVCTFKRFCLVLFSTGHHRWRSSRRPCLCPPPCAPADRGLSLTHRTVVRGDPSCLPRLFPFRARLHSTQLLRNFRCSTLTCISTDSQRRRRPTDHEWIRVQMRDAHKFLTKAEAVKFAPLRVHRTTKYHPALEYFQKHSLPRAICDEGIHVERAGCKRACGREHVPGICGGVDGVKLKRWRAYNNGGWRRG